MVGTADGEMLGVRLGMELGVVDGDVHVGNTRLIVKVNAFWLNASTSNSKAAETISSSRIEKVPTYPLLPAVKKTVSPDDEPKTLYSSDTTKVGWLQSGSVSSTENVPPTKRSIL